MSQFEFLLVFVSLIVAFAVSDILMSWGEEIRLRRIIRHYPLHTAWSLLVLLSLVQVWWSLWDYNEHPEWVFAEYVVLVLPFLTLSLMAYVLTPKFGDRALDLDVKAHYFGNARWVFTLGSLYVMLWMLYAYVMLGDPIGDPRGLPRAVILVLFLLLAVWRNERLHIAITVLAYLVMIGWITVPALQQ